MNFFNNTGKMAIGSRLRLLTEKITEDASNIYKMYQVELHPKWFPVYYVLSQGESKTVTSIAREIGHSHPSVSKIVSEMKKKGIILEKKDKADGRRNVVQLSQKGKEISERIRHQYTDVNNAIEDLSAKVRYDLWKAIEEWEFLLEQKSLFRRVQEQKKKRESEEIEIVDYQPKYRKAFRELNEEWILKYFEMEDADRRSLDNPKGYVIDKGGKILVALDKGQPVGVCALVKMDDPEYDFEIAKMAVSPKVQGKGIGYLLGKAAIEKAKSLGASKIFLESNTILQPAISLYQKLGFQKVVGHATPYARSNIQMGLSLKED